MSVSPAPTRRSQTRCDGIVRRPGDRSQPRRRRRAPRRPHASDPRAPANITLIINERVGTAAAISNAVYNATGKRIRKLQIRIDLLTA
jgi:hypothetical protein